MLDPGARYVLQGQLFPWRAAVPIELDQTMLHRARSEPDPLLALQGRRAFVEGVELPALTGLQIPQERQRRYHRLE